jgi:hypothetical protein
LTFAHWRDIPNPMRTVTASKPKPGRSRRRPVARNHHQPEPAGEDERAKLVRVIASVLAGDVRSLIAPVPLCTHYLRARLKRAIQHDPEIGVALADIDTCTQRSVAFLNRLADSTPHA